MARVAKAGGSGGFRARALAACVLVAAASAAAAPSSHHHPPPPPCTVSVSPSPGGAWTTAAGETVSAWDLGVSSASPTPSPWTLGLTADRSALAGVLQAWNLHSVRVVEGGAGEAAAGDGASFLTLTGEAPAAWQALPGGGGRRYAARVGLVVSLGPDAANATDDDAGPAFLPTAATLNGRACAVVAGPRKAAVVVSEDGDGGGGAPASDAQRPPPPGLTTRDGEIVGPDGKPLFFVGLNWFGFDCGATSAF
jgi:hypothetical protein